MFSRHLPRSLGGLLLGFLILSLGCGPNYKARGTVKGKVTFGGKNLTAGTVMFHGKNNLTGSATVGTDGNYVMTDAPVGDCKVTVTVPKMPPRGVEHLKGAPVGPKMPGDTTPDTVGKIPTQIVPIPDKYSNVETSGLSFTVSRGEQTYDIPLTP
jgi:hypothetical protein